MSTFAEAFRQWTDFPKGLHVLVVDRDTEFLQDITYKLESYHYFVTSFSSDEEACKALATYAQTFHVALVEATENNGLDSCKILSYSKDVPTIMTSTMENMSLMVKLIALGAVEFLVKPFSEDKIRNIWQHVIRKALDSSVETLRPGYLQPGKPTTSASTVLDEEHQECSKHEVGNPHPNSSENEHHNAMDMCRPSRLLVACERFAAPSTPQLEQGGRTALQESTLDESPRSDDSTEVCNYKENTTPETAPVSLLRRSSDVEEEVKELPTVPAGIMEVKKEQKDEQPEIFYCPIPKLESILQVEVANTSKMMVNKSVDSNNSSEDKEIVEKALQCDRNLMIEACEMSSTDDYEPQEARSSSISLPVTKKDIGKYQNAESTCQSETPGPYQEKGDASKESRFTNDKGRKDSKYAKKKIKVDWTADLHRRFVQAVEYLGVEQAIPSRILEVMKVEGLTRHNVASHLQKYRSHKKHLQARELEASKLQSKFNCGRAWNFVGQTANQTWIQPWAPLICPPLHVWGHPKVDYSASMYMAHQITDAPAPTSASAWPAFDNVPWKPPSVDPWSAGPPSVAPYFGPQLRFFPTFGYPHGEGRWRSFLENVENGSPDEKITSSNSGCQELHNSKELLDAAISEALSNPWMPLPLGLKPPSMESVLTELERQGITTLSSAR